MIVTLPSQVSARYPDIASGVFAAQPGSLVQICPGLYDESVTLVDSITLEGAGPELTIWEPASGGAILVDGDSSENLIVIRDITFTGGQGNQPSGWNVTCGGAVSIDNGAPFSVVLENLVFDQNSATYGGALCIDGGSFPVAEASVAIDGCTFTGNSSEQDGGAIHSYAGFAIAASEFFDNVAGRDGGAIYADYCESLEECTIDASVLFNNVANDIGLSHGGGAVYLDSYFAMGATQASRLTVTDSDLGFGAAQENQPDDLRTSFGASYGFYGNGVSFTCGSTCTDP